MYDTLIINGTTLFKTDGKWTHRGNEVDPRTIIRDLAGRNDYVEVEAIRTNGIVDIYEYVDGKHYHTTYAVNR